MPEHKAQQLYGPRICELEYQLLQDPDFAGPTYELSYQQNYIWKETVLI
jgi:hypothetical protein